MDTNITEEVFMRMNIQKHRILAVKRFLNGEKPSSICASLGRSRSWLNGSIAMLMVAIRGAKAAHVALSVTRHIPL